MGKITAVMVSEFGRGVSVSLQTAGGQRIVSKIFPEAGAFAVDHAACLSGMNRVPVRSSGGAGPDSVAASVSEFMSRLVAVGSALGYAA